MSETKATQTFTKLEDFKRWMQEEFTKHCKDTYGEDVYNKYIYAYKEDFLECVEYHIEDLAEQSIQDEEFNYANL